MKNLNSMLFFLPLASSHDLCGFSNNFYYPLGSDLLNFCIISGPHLFLSLNHFWSFSFADLIPCPARSNDVCPFLILFAIDFVNCHVSQSNSNVEFRFLETFATEAYMAVIKAHRWYSGNISVDKNQEQAIGFHSRR